MTGLSSTTVNRSLLAMVGLGLLGWLAWQNLSDEFRPDLSVPGGFVQRLEETASWQYDDEGRLAYSLVSPRAVQHDSEDRYTFDAPQAELIDEPGTPPWTLRARQGTLHKGGETVELEGDVRAGRAPYRDRGRLVLNTERLWLYPDRQIARTEVPSTLRELDESGSARWTSQANALTLDWGERVLTQVGGIHDRIEPGTRRP
ncbi:MAG: LPS export ABC transporter periplasmic protein LptC [Halothiobacillaceae bacterium]|nr:LPS export ABC transporter periplasmic protein LptC [Halothiobacillaceae bacterium]